MKINHRSALLVAGLVALAGATSSVQAAPTCSDSSTVETVRQLVIQVYPGHPTNEQEAALNKIDPVLTNIRTVPRTDGVHLCRASLVIHVFRKGGSRMSAGKTITETRPSGTERSPTPWR